MTRHEWETHIEGVWILEKTPAGSDKEHSIGCLCSLLSKMFGLGETYR